MFMNNGTKYIYIYIYILREVLLSRNAGRYTCRGNTTLYYSKNEGIFYGSNRIMCVTIAQPCAVSAIRLFKPGKQFRALSRNNIARRYSRSSFVAKTRKTRYLVLTAPAAALTIGWHYVTFNHPLSPPPPPSTREVQ